MSSKPTAKKALSARRPETLAVHGSGHRARVDGAGVFPIFRSTLWENRPDEGYHDVRYPRLSNLPNHAAIGEKLAALEGGEAGLVTASGMAAISASLLSLLGAGDHLLIQSCVYGGTHELVAADFARLGVGVDFVDAEDPAAWKAKLRPETKTFYVETLANPLLEMPDLVAVAGFAREHGLVSLIDNTFASPVNFRPIEHGFDLVLHSGTKYLNGHSDVAAGCVIGRREAVAAIKHKLDHLGGCLDPEAAYLLDRGVKTLSLRVERQNASALALARHLEADERVARVLHPGLPSHAQHERAARLLDGFGGMLSFELAAGAQAADALIRGLELAIPSASLGGVETVITRPAATSHAGMSARDRARLGIGDGLIRLSVGIEAVEDLIEDFDRGLAQAASV